MRKPIAPVADLHTHTIATDHAYSTLLENIAFGKRAGIHALAMTEHCSALLDSPCPWHFGYSQIPRSVDGTLILKGAELNILDTQGNVDMEEEFLRKLDFVIASMHLPVFTPDHSEDEVSQAWMNIARNPLIDCIGHCGDSHYIFHYEEVLPIFKEYGKIVEINNHSFNARPGTEKNCKSIAMLCKRLEIPIVVNSDAHFATSVGKFDKALAMLNEIDFPEELVLNNSITRLLSFLNAKPHKNKIEWSE